MLNNPAKYQQFVLGRESLSVASRGLHDIKQGFDLNVQQGQGGAWYSVPNLEHGNAQRQKNAGYRGPGIAPGDMSEKLLMKAANDLLLEAEQDNRPIECLVVTFRAGNTIKALKSVKHRLTPESTVLFFIRNGSGAIDEVNNEVFPDPSTRPHYISGVSRHGLTGRFPFHVTHCRIGPVLLSPVPPSFPQAVNVEEEEEEEEEEDWAPTTKYLLHTLTTTPALVAVTVPYTEVLQYQYERLAIYSIIDPLTALLDCRNGEPLYHMSFSRVVQLLLIEISAVICHLPELRGVPGVEHRFSVERLRQIAISTMNKTGGMSSAMTKDVHEGRILDVGHLNGFIVTRGEDLGIKCPLNYMIMQLVIAKRQIRLQREERAIPMEDLGGEFDQ